MADCSKVALATVVALSCVASARTASAGIFSTLYRTDSYIEGLRLADRADDTVYTAEPGWFYEVVADDATTYTIKFRRRSGEPRYEPFRNTATHSVVADRYYSVPRASLDTRLSRLFVQGLDPGIVVAPFKFRQNVPSGPSQIAGEATVGAALGVRFATDLLTTVVEPFVAFGLAQVAIKDGAEDATKGTQALSFGAGVQLEIRDRVSMGLAVGWDHVPGLEGKTWPYQGRPWYALSLNQGFLKRSGNSSEGTAPQATEKSSKSETKPKSK